MRLIKLMVVVGLYLHRAVILIVYVGVRPGVAKEDSGRPILRVYLVAPASQLADEDATTKDAQVVETRASSCESLERCEVFGQQLMW